MTCKLSEIMIIVTKFVAEHGSNSFVKDVVRILTHDDGVAEWIEHYITWATASLDGGVPVHPDEGR
jgi:hypothetical protein